MYVFPPFSLVGRVLRRILDEGVHAVLVAPAWRNQPIKDIYSILRKWALYCVEHDVSLLRPSIPEVCKFLRLLAEKGLGYSGVNAARSALSVILPRFDGNTIGKHPMITWLVRGV